MFASFQQAPLVLLAPVRTLLATYIVLPVACIYRDPIKKQKKPPKTTTKKQTKNNQNSQTQQNKPKCPNPLALQI